MEVSVEACLPGLDLPHSLHQGVVPGARRAGGGTLRESGGLWEAVGPAPGRAARGARTCPSLMSFSLVFLPFSKDKRRFQESGQKQFFSRTSTLGGTPTEGSGSSFRLRLFLVEALGPPLLATAATVRAAYSRNMGKDYYSILGISKDVRALSSLAPLPLSPSSLLSVALLCFSDLGAPKLHVLGLRAVRITNSPLRC